MLWRVAAYQVLLAVTGIAFVFFVGRAAGRSNRATEKTRTDRSAAEAPASTESESRG